MKNRNQRQIHIGKLFGNFVNFIYYGLALLFVAALVWAFFYDRQTKKQLDQLDSNDLFDVCQGVAHEDYPPYDGKPGIHRAISFRHDGSLSLTYIPDEADATSKESTELVVCLGEVKQITLEPCRYTGGYEIIRGREEQDIAIYEIATGKLIASETLTSSVSETPPTGQSGCPEFQEFPEGQKQIFTGSKMYLSKIQDWVRQYAIIEGNP